jgi:peptidoglycan L-alanyl-D-glutamate endopeptidase CwlK
LLVLIYAIAIFAAGWHVLDIRRRSSIGKRLRDRTAGGAAWAGSRINLLRRAPSACWHATSTAFTASAGAAWRYRRMCGASILLLAAPATLLLTFGKVSRLQSYDETAARRDPVVAALLEGEQLVPPAALPPAVFSTREAGSDRTELATASREWTLLDADFRQRLLLVFRAMERRGYRMVLLEGYRSPERQQMLANLGTHVTNAKAFQSYHQFGLAADSAFYRDGKLIISERDAWAMEGYRLYGEYAESVGLVWGGRWQMRDLGHVELRRTGTVR